MKNAKHHERKHLEAKQTTDELLEYGRQLHSKAVFDTMLKLFRIVHSIRIVDQLSKRQRSLKLARH